MTTALRRIPIILLKITIEPVIMIRGDSSTSTFLWGVKRGVSRIFSTSIF